MIYAKCNKSNEWMVDHKREILWAAATPTMWNAMYTYLPLPVIYGNIMIAFTKILIKKA